MEAILRFYFDSHLLEHFLWNWYQVSTIKLIEDKPTLDQVMSSCQAASSHYPRQCEPDLYSHKASLSHSDLKMLHRYAVLLHPWSSQWRQNGCDGVSNRQPYHCLFNRLFRRSVKSAIKLFYSLFWWNISLTKGCSCNARRLRCALRSRLCHYRF